MYLLIYLLFYNLINLIEIFFVAFRQFFTFIIGQSFGKLIKMVFSLFQSSA